MPISEDVFQISEDASWNRQFF